MTIQTVFSISLEKDEELWVVPERFEWVPLERHMIGSMDFDVGEFCLGDGHGCDFTRPVAYATP